MMYIVYVILSTFSSSLTVPHHTDHDLSISQTMCCVRKRKPSFLFDCFRLNNLQYSMCSDVIYTYYKYTIDIVLLGQAYTHNKTTVKNKWHTLVHKAVQGSINTIASTVCMVGALGFVAVSIAYILVDTSEGRISLLRLLVLSSWQLSILVKIVWDNWAQIK